MWVENKIAALDWGEPTYEIINDQKTRGAITQWLKAAGFEKWTSYIPTQSNQNELVIQITRFEWKRIGNTGSISLQAWVDFVNKNGEVIITQDGINKMKANYIAIKSMIQSKWVITASIHGEIDTITA